MAGSGTSIRNILILEQTRGGQYYKLNFKWYKWRKIFVDDNTSNITYIDFNSAGNGSNIHILH